MSSLIDLYTTIILLRDRLALSFDQTLSSEELAQVQQLVQKDYESIYMMGERGAITNEEIKLYEMNATIQERLDLNIIGQWAYEALIQMGELFTSPKIERERPLLEERLQRLKKNRKNLLILIQQRQALKVLESATRKCREVQQKVAETIKILEDHYQKAHMNEGTVRVLCRIRPFENPNSQEIIQWLFWVKIKYRKSRPNVIDPSKEDIHQWLSCSLDYVFPKEIRQRDVFTQVQYLVHSAMNKGRSLILTIGQSGSGNTHTMIGQAKSILEPQSEHAGIVPRAILLAFQLAAKDNKRISIQYHQFFDRDAKTSTTKSSQPRVSFKARCLSVQKPQKPIQSIKFMQEETTWPKSVQQALCTLKQKISERKTAKTKMNDSSSRSHLLICLRINQGNKMQGMISFLDMAGKERMRHGNPAKETAFITSSISEMTQILKAMRNNEYYSYANYPVFVKHLQPYLQGNKVLSIITLSSKMQDEQFNQTSIEFARDIRQNK